MQYELYTHDQYIPNGQRMMPTDMAVHLFVLNETAYRVVVKQRTDQICQRRINKSDDCIHYFTFYHLYA